MRPQEGTYLAHCQRNSFLGFLPREHAHLGVRRQHRGFHRHRVRVCRDVVRQDEDRRLARAHEIARHGEDEVGVVRYILVRNLSTISIVISGRRFVSSGPQAFMLLS